MATDGLVATLRTARPERFHVTCLPDLFLDLVVPMPAWSESRDLIEGVVGRGGGNLLTGPHRASVGGNAANCARALARLGVGARLIASTSPLGGTLAAATLGSDGVDLTLLRTDAELSATAALEFGPQRANVMISDPGSLRDWGPARLSPADLAAIRASDAVLVTNWGQNRAGTDLAARVFAEARRGEAMTYFDPGDPTPRLGELPELARRVAASPDLDVLACNDSELALLAHAFGAPRTDGLAQRARSVQALMPGTLDVHTRAAAATVGRTGSAEATPPAVPGVRATGAGDAWNAGNLLGYLLELAPRDRLRLANGVATGFVTAKDAVPPTLQDTLGILEAHAP